VTRTERIDFGSGLRQRRRILETLALLPAAGAAVEPLTGGGGLELRFETATMGVA
jgi:hypothetical protein